MKSLILICIVTLGCYGCTNSNVYSRGELPPWYNELTTECDNKEECFT